MGEGEKNLREHVLPQSLQLAGQGCDESSLEDTQACTASTPCTWRPCEAERGDGVGKINMPDTVRFSVDHVRAGYMAGVLGPLGHNLSSFDPRNLRFLFRFPFSGKVLPLSHGCLRYGFCSY